MTTQNTTDTAPVDNINPAHYRNHPSGIQIIEMTRHMPFNLGNAFKYIARALHKHDCPAEDYKKAKWYVEDYIAHCNERMHVKSLWEQAAAYYLDIKARFFAAERPHTHSHFNPLHILQRMHEEHGYHVVDLGGLVLQWLDVEIQKAIDSRPPEFEQFCKIFHSDRVGQVVVTKSSGDNGDPCVRVEMDVNPFGMDAFWAIAPTWPHSDEGFKNRDEYFDTIDAAKAEGFVDHAENIMLEAVANAEEEE